MIGEYRQRCRLQIYRRLFGEDFRMEKPAETLGGALRILLDERNVDRLHEAQGRAHALLESLAILDQAAKELD